MLKEKWQELLDKTDLDEKIKAEIENLDDRAKAGIEKYLTSKVRRKALIIGAAVGLVVGVLVGKILL